MTTRQRVIPYDMSSHSWLVTWQTFWGDAVGSTTLYQDDQSAMFSDAFRGTQITTSENHPEWKSRKPGKFTQDSGGPFFTQKKWTVSVNAKPVLLNGDDWPRQAMWRNYSRYYGPLLPLPPYMMGFPDHSVSSNKTLDELGTTAIARCSPSNPSAELATFLGETVKDGIPKLDYLLKLKSMSSSDRKKALAEAHLDTQFTWKPLVQDIVDVAVAIDQADAIWAQYERDAGKLVRRRYEFPVKKTTEVIDMGRRNPYIPQSSSTLYSSEGPSSDSKVYCVTEHTVRQWFSGAFSYYLPSERGGLADQVIQAKKIYGLSFTPDVLWNLTPWSWAIDWFTNAGDVVSNWSNWLIDGQVLWYGYMMEHSISERTYYYTGRSGFLTQPSVPSPVVLRVETKRRRPATPYGFGITWDGFSALQASIVAALGITRKR